MLKTKIVLLTLITMITPLKGSAADTRPMGTPYQYAYYLFLIGTPNGCEDCYIPLLLTKQPIDKLLGVDSTDSAVLIITYERDSIWEIKDTVPILIQNEKDQFYSRIIVIPEWKRKYRYSELSSTEVLSLLENPLGNISIHRMAHPTKYNKEKIVENLILDFRERQKEVDRK